MVEHVSNSYGVEYLIDFLVNLLLRIVQLLPGIALSSVINYYIYRTNNSD